MRMRRQEALLVPSRQAVAWRDHRKRGGPSAAGRGKSALAKQAQRIGSSRPSGLSCTRAPLAWDLRRGESTRVARSDRAPAETDDALARSYVAPKAKIVG